MYWARWPPLCGATLWHRSVCGPLAFLLFGQGSNSIRLVLLVLGAVIALHQLSLLLSPGAIVGPCGHVTRPGVLGGRRHAKGRVPLVRFAGMSEYVPLGCGIHVFFLAIAFIYVLAVTCHVLVGYSFL